MTNNCSALVVIRSDRNETVNQDKVGHVEDKCGETHPKVIYVAFAYAFGIEDAVVV